MMFDVGVRLGYNASGKAMNRYYRVHDTLLSVSIRKAQDAGQYVFSIIPLFRKKQNTMIPIDMDKESLDDVMVFNREVMRKHSDERDTVDPIENRAMIDPHGM
jgi:hypothetical protein